MSKTREEMDRARIVARRRIVFESPHGCNNDLADDVFAKSWDAALATLEPLIRVQVIEECASWHDEQAKAARAKYNPRFNIIALLVTRVHEDSAAAIRSLGKQGGAK